MRNLPHFDIERDMLFVEIEDEVAAYCYLNWRHETDGPYVYRLRAFVHPAWRHKGIGSTLQTFCEKRAIEVAESHPADAAKAFSTSQGLRDAMQRAGIQGQPRILVVNET